MLFCFNAHTGELVHEFSDPALIDPINERHVDAPVGIAIIPGEHCSGTRKKELLIVNESELLQYALVYDKKEGPQLKLRQQFELPSWGFSVITQRRWEVPSPSLPAGSSPLPSPFSFTWEDSDMARLTDADYNVLITLPERAEILRFNPDTRVSDNFSMRLKTRKFTGTDGNLKNDFIPTDMKFGPDGALYVSSVAKNAVLKLGGLTGHLMEVFTKTPVSSPTGLAFLYHKTCGFSEGPEMVVWDLLVASLADHCVYRFDGLTGELKDQFVKPHAGGLDQPVGIGISPYDNQLYVASSKTGAILKYNNATGEFISAFTPAKDRMVSPSLFTWDIEYRPPPPEFCTTLPTRPRHTRREPPPMPDDLQEQEGGVAAQPLPVQVKAVRVVEGLTEGMTPDEAARFLAEKANE